MSVIDAPEKIKIPDTIPINLGKSSIKGDDSLYAVWLWNDEHNSMDYVITVLIRVIPNMDLNRAASLMLIAHTKGSVSVVEAPKEQAEHYREQLELAKLTATIEKA